MKKIALLIAAVAVTATLNAQVVVGLQGGYHSTASVNNLDTNSTAALNWLGGAQLGYMVTPRLYIGVSGQYNHFRNDTMMAHKVIPYGGRIPDPTVDNFHTVVQRDGWSVSPQVKYEFLSYGNMHFHIMLQGTVGQTGYATIVQSFYTPFLNNGEYHELDAVQDSVRTFYWGVSLRPTITYEFSRHLSAELSLDLLSVGFASHKTMYDNLDITNRDGEADVYTESATTLYAGLNSLMETLRWESPMLRLGFNWTF
ncbi:MAG: hypothetical protein IJ760_07340 [Bacteroidales bacterium]|nr:hypothetical protein [Bacteroidales bacterium]